MYVTEPHVRVGDTNIYLRHRAPISGGRPYVSALSGNPVSEECSPHIVVQNVTMDKLLYHIILYLLC